MATVAEWAERLQRELDVEQVSSERPARRGGRADGAERLLAGQRRRRLLGRGDVPQQRSARPLSEA